MDEYSKSAPRSSRAEIRERESAAKKKAMELLESSTEEQFRQALLQDFRVDPQHPRFSQMLQLWRARHPRS